MLVRQCEKCEARFLVQPSQVNAGRGRFCSRGCWYARYGHTAECRTCGRSFQIPPQRVGTAKYCSRRCVPSALLSATCGNCGKQFEFSKSAKRKYCSIRCGYERADALRVDPDHSRLRSIWRGVKHRCETGEGQPCWPYYGGRGIKLCGDWSQSFEAFKAWALANGYAVDLELDRRDNDGDYTPENCRWATRQQQMRNTRKRRDARTSKFRGVSRHSQNRRWIAQIVAPGRRQYIGSFDSEEEAARAYDQAAHECFGEFAALNFPSGQGGGSR